MNSQAKIAITLLLALSLGQIIFCSTGRDDSHITFWSAHTLASQGEILNLNGERLEQCSSLAHTLFLAALAAIFPIAMPTLGGLFSIFFGAASIIITTSLAKMVDKAIADSCSFIVAASVGLIYWSFSGMETTFVTFLSTWLILILIRYHENCFRLKATIQLVFACLLYLLARPEAFFILSSTFIGTALLLMLPRLRVLKVVDLSSRPTLTALLFCLLLSLGLFSIITIFRFYYFGSLFPQPVSAKSSGMSLSLILRGLSYLNRHALSRCSMIFWILAFAGAIRIIFLTIVGRRVNFAEQVIGIAWVANLAFVIFAGGDWMSGGRFLVHFFPLTSILAVSLLRTMLIRHAYLPTIAVLVFLEVVAVLMFARKEGTGDPIWIAMRRSRNQETDKYSWFEKTNRVNYLDMWLTSRVSEGVEIIEEIADGKVTILGGQMGFVPYHISRKYGGRVRFIDRFGLIDADFTACPFTSERRGGRFGLDLGYDYLLPNWQHIQDTCSIRAPDLIFDWDEGWGRKIDGGDIDIVESNGYTVVYKREIELPTRSVIFPGPNHSADQYVAVRDDLLWAFDEQM